MSASIATAGAVAAPALVPADWRLDWSEGWAFFLDIDGTLLDIAAHPDAVVVPDGLLLALERIRRQCGGALALVTGRGIASVDALFGPGRFDCAANHGAVLRIGSVTREENRLDARQVIDSLTPALREIEGVLVEDKIHSVALHYRAAPAAEPIIRRAVAAALEHEGERWRIVDGKAVIEVAPRGLTKGTAIAAFLETPPFQGRRPFFAGDDTTDEDAFAAVRELGGLGLFVGPERQSLATLRILSPSAFRAWLGAPTP